MPKPLTASIKLDTIRCNRKFSPCNIFIRVWGVWLIWPHFIALMIFSPLPLCCKDIAYRLMLFFSFSPLSAHPHSSSAVIAMHCWWGESASYVLSLLKSFLMEWKPYILFPNEAQEWQTAPLGLSYGCLQVEATGPSQAALREPAGDAGLGQQTAYVSIYSQAVGRVCTKSKIK